ncbi:MAG: MFS transporter, partial [Chloroflexi bacterium]|nr:MFS transporter [Chloroflexota bacterium]
MTVTSHPTLGPRWKRNFAAIWLGQQISLLGSTVAGFALVWWLTQRTGSATILATASLVAILPEVLLGPIAGAYVDRWNRRLVMIVADGAIALVSLWLAFLFWSGRMQVWHVYVIMVARSLGGCFHWPASMASTRLLVPEEHLARVQGLNQTVQGALKVAGPPMGALLLAWLPLHGIMFIDVGTAALAIMLLLMAHMEGRVRCRAQAYRLRPVAF